MSEFQTRDDRQVASSPAKTPFQLNPTASYFIPTFAVSWTAAFLVAAPKLLRGESLPTLNGILTFPAMLLGPVSCGILLTRIVNDAGGLRDLVARGTRFRVPLRWYAWLLVPPMAVLMILSNLKTFVYPVYTPNRSYGSVTAGILEEIGWMGFAYPKMNQRFSPFRAAVFRGLLWGIGHLPVIDFLGAATPHRTAWFPFFLAFTGGHDGDVRDHCVGVHQHRESPAGSTLAHQLAWFFGRLQPGRRVAHAGGVLECRLCCASLARSAGPRGSSSQRQFDCIPLTKRVDGFPRAKSG
jgi:uncharacterized protein